MIDPTTKLGDLVSARPELARELERRGLDYCCGATKHSPTHVLPSASTSSPRSPSSPPR